MAEVPYQRLSDYDFFVGELDKLEPRPGVVPFEPVSPLWADGALKYRFLYLPEGETISFHENEDWDFPVGTIAIKHFAFAPDLREGDAGRDLIETRLLVKESDGIHAYEYLWNDERSDAMRDVSGDRIAVQYVDENGESVAHDYIAPNETQCGNCHTRDDEMRFLGLTTRQLNHTLDGRNTLERFADEGMFDAEIPAVGTLPALVRPSNEGEVEPRARAWLDANCAHCHRPGGGGGNSGLTLLAAEKDPTAFGVCKLPVAAGPGAGGFTYDIVPGAPAESIMIFRVSSDDSTIRMPELPVLTVDSLGLDLLTAWIDGMSPEGCE